MKKSIILVLAVFSFVLTPSFSQEDSTLIFEQDTLKSLANRFEVGVSMGYSIIDNFTANAKTTNFSEYNNGLGGGLNTGVYVGYNFSTPLFFRVSYAYRNTGNSELYADSVAGSFNVADEYHFHELGATIGYRFKVIDNTLFLTTGVGMSYVLFKNNGQMEVPYTQKSTGLSYVGSLGLEYFASNHLGFGANINYSMLTLQEHDLKIDGASTIYDRVPDDKFTFTDIQMRIFYLF